MSNITFDMKAIQADPQAGIVIPFAPSISSITGPTGPCCPVVTYPAMTGTGKAGDAVRIDETGGMCGTILMFDPNGVDYPSGASNPRWKLKETSAPYQTTVGTIGTGRAMFSTVQAALNAGCCFIRIIGTGGITPNNVFDTDLTIPMLIPPITNVIIYIDPGVNWFLTNNSPTNISGKSFSIQGSGDTSRLVLRGAANPQFTSPSTLGQTSPFNIDKIHVILSVFSKTLVDPKITTRITDSTFSLPNISGGSHLIGTFASVQIEDTYISNVIINSGGTSTNNVFIGSTTSANPRGLNVQGIWYRGTFGSPVYNVTGPKQTQNGVFCTGVSGISPGAISMIISGGSLRGVNVNQSDPLSFCDLTINGAGAIVSDCHLRNLTVTGSSTHINNTLCTGLLQLGAAINNSSFSNITCDTFDTSAFVVTTPLNVEINNLSIRSAASSFTMKIPPKCNFNNLDVNFTSNSTVLTVEMVNSTLSNVVIGCSAGLMGGDVVFAGVNDSLKASVSNFRTTSTSGNISIGISSTVCTNMAFTNINSFGGISINNATFISLNGAKCGNAFTVGNLNTSVGVATCSDIQVCEVTATGISIGVPTTPVIGFVSNTVTKSQFTNLSSTTTVDICLANFANTTVSNSKFVNIHATTDLNIAAVNIAGGDGRDIFNFTGNQVTNISGKNISLGLVYGSNGIVDNILYIEDNVFSGIQAGESFIAMSPLTNGRLFARRNKISNITSGMVAFIIGVLPTLIGTAFFEHSHNIYDNITIHQSGTIPVIQLSTMPITTSGCNIMSNVTCGRDLSITNGRGNKYKGFVIGAGGPNEFNVILSGDEEHFDDWQVGGKLFIGTADNTASKCIFNNFTIPNTNSGGYATVVKTNRFGSCQFSNFTSPIFTVQNVADGGQYSNITTDREFQVAGIYNRFSNISYTVYAAAPVFINTVSFTSTSVMTVQLLAPHSFLPGQLVRIANPIGYRGAFAVINTPTPTSFTYITPGPLPPSTIVPGIVFLAGLTSVNADNNHFVNLWSNALNNYTIEFVDGHETYISNSIFSPIGHSIGDPVHTSGLSCSICSCQLGETGSPGTISFPPVSGIAVGNVAIVTGGNPSGVGLNIT